MKQSDLHVLKSRGGFTLLEVIISMTILGVLAAILYNGLWLSIRARERGEDLVENNQRMRAIYMLIASQIKSAQPYFYPDRENPKIRKFAFTGKPDSIQFITSAARLTPGKVPEGMHEVTLFLEEDSGDTGLGRLLLRESTVHYPRIFEDKTDPSVLAEDVTDLHFRYYFKKEDEEGNVQGRWTEQYDEEMFENERSVTNPNDPNPGKGAGGENKGKKSALVNLPLAVEISWTLSLPRGGNGEKKRTELSFPPTVIYLNAGLEGTPALKPESEIEETAQEGA